VAYNPYIIVPLATWAVAQISKFAIAAFKGKVDFRYLYASGGMPSVHSAVVCALATTAFLVDGVDSHLFGFTVIFAAVVMYDSFGVRRSAGEQAAAINMLIGSLGRNKVKIDNPHLHLREILGHQPREVTAGAILGVLLAMLFNYDRLGALGTFIEAVPKRPEMLAYLAIFLVLIIGGALARFILRARYRKSRTMRDLAGKIFVATQTIGWLGLFTVAMVYERASYFAWRLWPLVVLLAGVLWAIWLATANYRTVPANLEAEVEQARKEKWLGAGRRKK
jgi:acid phosphatase family membrane protein YuiD